MIIVFMSECIASFIAQSKLFHAGERRENQQTPPNAKTKP